MTDFSRDKQLIADSFGEAYATVSANPRLLPRDRRETARIRRLFLRSLDSNDFDGMRQNLEQLSEFGTNADT